MPPSKTMCIQTHYKNLLAGSESNYHLVLARFFKEIYGRPLKNEEWPLLRRLIKLHGAETVFWSLVESAHLNAEGNVLMYISKVCITTSKEAASNVSEPALEKTNELIKHMKEQKERCLHLNHTT